MTDQELLRLVAPLAKAEWSDYGNRLPDELISEKQNGVWSAWNPLKNWADAFALMVRAGVSIDCEHERCGAVTATVGCDRSGTVEFEVTVDAPEGGDDFAAVCRAIVLAAARVPGEPA